MIRRDTELLHSYSQKVFDEVGIYEIQGLLKNDDTFKCGIESYQVKNFDLISFDNLDKDSELAKYFFCKRLGIPYYVIIVSEDNCRYKIFRASLSSDHIEYKILYSFKKDMFLKWWKSHQDFDQKKPMYNAKKRINESIIDRDLFENSLSWGVNIDGFILSDDKKDIKAIVEKRISNYKSISSYDPQKYFYGNRNRSGDYPSWKILFDLSESVDALLFLLTFDGDDTENVGVAKIDYIDSDLGIVYEHNTKPYHNIFNKNINGLKNWIKNKL